MSFKIDMRFIFDHGDKEYDVATGELSKIFLDDQKLFSDEGKLVREGKEVLDGLLFSIVGKKADCEVGGWILQLSGELLV